MTEFIARMTRSGRVSIPAHIRKKAGWSEGEELVFHATPDGRVIVQSRARMIEDAVRRARALVRKYVPADVSLVDELRSERRAEAARENPE